MRSIQSKLVVNRISRSIEIEKQGLVHKMALPCPICGVRFQDTDMDLHVEICLETSKSKLPKPPITACAVAVAATDDGSNEAAAILVDDGDEEESEDASTERQHIHMNYYPLFSFKEANTTTKDENHIKYYQSNGNRQWRLVDQSMVGPFFVIKNSIPDVLSLRLLNILLDCSRKDNWIRREWANMGVARRKTCAFDFELDEYPEIPGADTDDKMLRRYVGKSNLAKEIIETRNIIDGIVQNFIKNEQNSIVRSMDENDKDIVRNFKSSYVLANLYENVCDGVGFHSDSLSELGPRPVIASLSLGASREFRWKESLLGEIDDDRNETNKKSVKSASTFSTLLRHNDLILMLPSSQEEYKHEIPYSKSDYVPASHKFVEKHRVSGDIRINLTFRMRHPTLSKNIPLCGCRKPAYLKPVFDRASSSFGKYFYACQHHRCEFFKWLSEKENMQNFKHDSL